MKQYRRTECKTHHHHYQLSDVLNDLQSFKEDRADGTSGVAYFSGEMLRPATTGHPSFAQTH